MKIKLVLNGFITPDGYLNALEGVYKLVVQLKNTSDEVSNWEIQSSVDTASFIEVNIDPNVYTAMLILNDQGGNPVANSYGIAVDLQNINAEVTIEFPSLLL